MKIVDIRTTALSCPCPTPYASANLMQTKRDALLVEIETEEGLVGIGEAGTGGGAAQTPDGPDACTDAARPGSADDRGPVAQSTHTKTRRMAAAASSCTASAGSTSRCGTAGEVKLPV